MKKQIFAVCDLEAEYACNFMDYLNQKKNIPFEIQAFTSVESLVAYVKKNPVELLLISSEAMCREVGELDIGKIVILTEGSKPKELRWFDTRHASLTFDRCSEGRTFTTNKGTCTTIDM